MSNVLKTFEVRILSNANFVTSLSIYSIYVSDSLFPQSLSKFSLVYLFTWHRPPHTLHISSRNHCLLFAAHAHTIATCFAIVPRLCHLILCSLSSLYFELYRELNATHPSNHSHLCKLKCHLSMWIE